MPRFDEDLRRYTSFESRDQAYKNWVKRNGYPKLEQGCINCAELECYKDCKGITDERVKKMTLIISGT